MWFIIYCMKYFFQNVASLKGTLGPQPTLCFFPWFLFHISVTSLSPTPFVCCFLTFDLTGFLYHMLLLWCIPLPEVKNDDAAWFRPIMLRFTIKINLSALSLNPQAFHCSNAGLTNSVYSVLTGKKSNSLCFPKILMSCHSPICFYLWENYVPYLPPKAYEKKILTHNQTWSRESLGTHSS